MELKFLNISQLSTITGIDRATIVKHLSDLEPINSKNNLKVYLGALAIPLLFERTKKNYTVNWSDIILNLLRDETLKINKDLS